MRSNFFPYQLHWFWNLRFVSHRKLSIIGFDFYFCCHSLSIPIAIWFSLQSYYSTLLHSIFLLSLTSHANLRFLFFSLPTHMSVSSLSLHADSLVLTHSFYLLESDYFSYFHSLFWSDPISETFDSQSSLFRSSNIQSHHSIFHSQVWLLSSDSQSHNSSHRFLISVSLYWVIATRYYHTAISSDFGFGSSPRFRICSSKCWFRSVSDSPGFVARHAVYWSRTRVCRSALGVLDP